MAEKSKIKKIKKKPVSLREISYICMPIRVMSKVVKYCLSFLLLLFLTGMASQASMTRKQTSVRAERSRYTFLDERTPCAGFFIARNDHRNTHDLKSPFFIVSEIVSCIGANTFSKQLSGTSCLVSYLFDEELVLPEYSIMTPDLRFDRRVRYVYALRRILI